MLSILIPTYNYSVINLVEQVNKQAIEATIVFEIIVIDDFSNNLEIVNQNRKIKEIPHCVYSENKKNIGRTATRNELTKNAKHQWLLFLDADVLPKNENFIEKFIKNINQNELIFGGIDYLEAPPTNEKLLRWKYGKARENLSVAQRLKKPYQTINSGCFLIKKTLFQNINHKINIQKYGMDILFKQVLFEYQTKIKHIDNQVYHLGLESSQHFINKSLEAIETIVYLEKNNYLKTMISPLQKSFLKLKKWKLIPVFSFFISKMKNIMERNFLSNKPNLFWFDLYRLQYYIELKSKKSA